MPTLNIQKLTKLAEDKKWEELEKEIKAWLNEDLKPEEKGELKLMYLQTVLKLQNKYSEEYSKSLDKIIALANKLGEVEEKVDSADKIKKIKDKIKNLF